MKAFQSLAVAGALLAIGADATGKNNCEPGSDAVCSRFGTSMCCAHVQYTFQGDQQDFYSCASKPGIEFTNGQINDAFGFVGTWYCAGAVELAASLTTAAIIVTTQLF